jgi:hypothetical protein
MNLLDTLFSRLQLKRDYAETFNTPHGRRVLADILRRSGVTAPKFESDPEKARLMEGHRHLAHSIYRMVHASDEPLLKLISEEQRRNSENTHVTDH